MDAEAERRQPSLLRCASTSLEGSGQQLRLKRLQAVTFTLRSHVHPRARGLSTVELDPEKPSVLLWLCKRVARCVFVGQKPALRASPAAF